MDFTRNEYKIIGTLYQNMCFSKLCSFKIQKMADETGLSVPKIRQSMRMFLSLGLVDKGARDERADTYYLTNEGIQTAEENMRIDPELLKRIEKIKSVKGDN